MSYKGELQTLISTGRAGRTGSVDNLVEETGKKLISYCVQI